MDGSGRMISIEKHFSTKSHLKKPLRGLSKVIVYTHKRRKWQCLSTHSGLTEGTPFPRMTVSFPPMLLKQELKEKLIGHSSIPAATRQTCFRPSTCQEDDVANIPCRISNRSTHSRATCLSAYREWPAGSASPKTMAWSISTFPEAISQTFSSGRMISARKRGT